MRTACGALETSARLMPRCFCGMIDIAPVPMGFCGNEVYMRTGFRDPAHVVVKVCFRKSVEEKAFRLCGCNEVGIPCHGSASALSYRIAFVSMGGRED